MGAYLVFLFTIPLGETSIAGNLPWLTPTKAGFLLLLAALGVAYVLGWRPPLRVAVLAPVAVFIVAVFMSAGVGCGSGRSWLYALRLGALAGLCVATSWVVAERRTLPIILAALFGIGCGLSLLALYQTLSGRTIGTLGFYGEFGRMIDIFRPTPGGGVSVVRASATFDHPNVLGTFLLGIIPAGAVLCSRREQGRPARVLLATGLVVCVAAIVYTFSRSAWLGASVGLLIVVARPRFRTASILLPALGLAVAVALLPTGARRILWDRGGTVQSYDAGRLYSWRAAVAMIRAHPFLGVGPGRFDDVYDQYGAARSEYRQNRLHTMDAHNTFLDLAAEGGLLSMVPFAGGVGAVLVLVWRRRKVLEPEALAVMAGLTGIFVQSFLNSLEYEEIYWVLLGAGLAVCGSPRAAPSDS